MTQNHRRSRTTRVVNDTRMSLEDLIAARDFKAAWILVVNELEEDPKDREELKELFIFVLSTYR